MKTNIVKIITRNAIVAAIYFSLTLVTGPFSFGMLQVRIAEFLVLLCFFNRDYILGISVGCFLVNLLGNVFTGETLGIIDALIGTGATILSCLIVSYMKHLFVATLVPVIINGFAVGTELYFFLENKLNYFAYVGFVALGEFIAVSVIGYLIIKLLIKNQRFLELIDAKRNIPAQK